MFGYLCDVNTIQQCSF